MSTLANTSLSPRGRSAPPGLGTERNLQPREKSAATGRAELGDNGPGLSEDGGTLRSDRFLPAIVAPIRNQTQGLSPSGGKPGRRYCTMIKGFERTKGIVRLVKLSDTHRGGDRRCEGAF